MPGTCEILECLIDGVAVETATKVFLVELAPSGCVNFDCFFFWQSALTGLFLSFFNLTTWQVERMGACVLGTPETLFGQTRV